MGLKEFFSKLYATPTTLPHLIRIHNNNTDVAQQLEGAFIPEQHYFTVSVNEMFLSSRRKWLREIEPMVVSLSGYIYGEQKIEDPFVVGRSLFKDKSQEIPQGMLFLDTRVAGTHPYRGDRVTLSLVLCQYTSKDYLASSLKFVEDISGVFGESMKLLVNNYTNIARVLINGIDNLLDLKTIQPLFGFREEFGNGPNNEFTPGYFVLLDSSTKDPDPGKFFVKENRLYYGEDAGTAKPFRDDEYILFNVARSEERGDVSLLPVYQSYKKILEELKTPEVSAAQKDKIKDMLRVLNIEMRQSPDLTAPHAKKLMEKYIREVSDLIAPKFNFGAAFTEEKNDWSILDAKIQAL